MDHRQLRRERWKMELLSPHHRLRKHRAASLMLSLIMILVVPALTYLPLHSEIGLGLTQSVAASVNNHHTAQNERWLVVTKHDSNGLSRMPSCQHTKSFLQFVNTVRSLVACLIDFDLLCFEGILIISDDALIIFIYSFASHDKFHSTQHCQ